MKNKKPTQKQIHPVQDYFTFNSQTRKSTCKTGGCVMKGKHSYNLWRHIQRKHKEIAKVLYQLDLKCDNDNGIFVKINKKELIKSCVELTTVNGRPFSLLRDSGFKRLLKPVFNAFKEAGDSIGANEESIKEQSEIELKKIELQISNEMKDKIISLKFDSVTVMGR